MNKNSDKQEIVKNQLTKEDIIKIIENNEGLLKFYRKNLQMYRYTSSVFAVFSFTLLIFFIQFTKFLDPLKYILGLLSYNLALIIFIYCLLSVHYLNEKINLFLYKAFDKNYFSDKNILISKMKKIKKNSESLGQLINVTLLLVLVPFTLFLYLYHLLISILIFSMIVSIVIPVLFRSIKKLKGINDFNFSI